jgi:hypothetical protein
MLKDLLLYIIIKSYKTEEFTKKPNLKNKKCVSSINRM